MAGVEGVDLFDRFYVCFKALCDTWRAYCRPIIEIDGCFLKNNVKGQLLAAVGRDANNQLYPVAWGSCTSGKHRQLGMVHCKTQS